MKKIALLLLSISLSSSLALSALGNPPPSAHAENYRMMQDPELSTFASLITAANLTKFFDGTGPFTAFAPSNTAFQKLDPKMLQELKTPEKLDQLIDLINYHVVLGKYLAKSIKPGQMRTVNGKDIRIRVEGDEIWVNDAKVIKPNLVGPNGVIHVINEVLIP